MKNICFILKTCIFLLYISSKLVKSHPCPNGCSLHGRCRNPGQVCECFKGFEGPDCSLMSCPMGPAWVDVAYADDKAHSLAVCSNKGICNRISGTCICASGFEGAACQRMSCSSNCNGVGVCHSMNSYARTFDRGIIALDQDNLGKISDNYFVYDNIWDANMTHGCKCDRGSETCRCFI